MRGPSAASGSTLLLQAAAAATLTVGGCAALQWRRAGDRSAPQRSAARSEPEPEPDPLREKDARICKHWRKNGRCRRGGDCKYSHPEELAPPPAEAQRRARNDFQPPASSFTQGVPRLRLEGEQRFRAVVQYDGTDFEGWQTQVHGRTIQDELEKRLGAVLLGRGKRLAVAGSGRTDAGVHAAAQVFHFECPRDHWMFKATGEQHDRLKSPAELTAERLLKSMRHGTTMRTQATDIASVRLPYSRVKERPVSAGAGCSMAIRVISVEPVSQTFHARHSCTAKRYVYTVRDG